MAATAETAVARDRRAVVTPAWRPPLWMTLAGVLAVLTLAPYLYGHAAQPPGRVFMGFFFLGDDANTYLAKMRQGWEGSWTWSNRYTTESSPAVYFFLYWIALGHLAALVHLPLLATFHLARVAGAFLLLGGSWAFICRFVPDPAARRFGLVFLSLCLGLGYVTWLAGHPVVFGVQTEALDWRMPELTAFYSILALPHFAWAAGFEALAVVLGLAAAERASWRFGFLSGLAWLGLASIHPQMPILVGAALGAALVLRPVSPRGYAAAGLGLAMAAPYVAYSYFAFLGNPEVTRWTSHWRNNFAPDLLSLVLGLGPQLTLAALALPGMLRRRSRADVLLLAWLILLAAILWLPNPAANLRRRFFDGVFLPIDCMAAMGMYSVVLPRLPSLRARNLFRFAWVAFAAVPSLYLLLAPMAVATSPQYSSSTGEYHALLWFGDHAPGVVMSDPYLGLLVPAYSADTVFVGQYSETYDYFRKGREVLAAYQGQTDLAAYARSHGARYVVWTPADDPGHSPPATLGTPVFSENGVEIFDLSRTG